MMWRFDVIPLFYDWLLIAIFATRQQKPTKYWCKTRLKYSTRRDGTSFRRTFEHKSYVCAHVVITNFRVHTHLVAMGCTTPAQVSGTRDQMIYFQMRNALFLRYHGSCDNTIFSQPYPKTCASRTAYGQVSQTVLLDSNWFRSPRVLYPTCKTKKTALAPLSDCRLLKVSWVVC